jgi:hypothetical protein
MVITVVTTTIDLVLKAMRLTGPMTEAKGLHRTVMTMIYREMSLSK